MKTNRRSLLKALFVTPLLSKLPRLKPVLNKGDVLPIKFVYSKVMLDRLKPSFKFKEFLELDSIIKSGTGKLITFDRYASIKNQPS